MPGSRPPLSLIPGGARGETLRADRAGRGTGVALELTGLGTGLVLTLALMARIPSWAHELGTFQSLYAVAFVFYALALARATRVPTVRRGALLVVGVGIAARLALLPVAPTLSDDVHRYIWEGKVVAHGGNPYAMSPGDTLLAPLRDSRVFPHVNHPELATIYPPVAMAGFALVAAISPTVWAMKLWIVLHDLALVLVLLVWSRARREGALPVLAYAWNPLVLVEYAGSGHHDPTASLWLVASLYWSERRPMASALALAAGALTKLVPLVALPFLLRRWPWRARAVALLAIGTGLVWFWSATRGASSGLGAYARTWANNDLLFYYLAAALRDPFIARWVAAALLIAVLALALWRGWETVRSTRLALRAGLLLSPVAHPWYLGWVLSLEPLGASPPWVLLSLTAVLSYGVLAPPAQGPGFHLSLAGRWVEYGAPLLLAIAIAMVRPGRSRAGAS